MGWEAVAGIGAAVAPLADTIINNAVGWQEMRGNQHFQRDMSNTAHYREVQDLKRAGLNPILSATNLHGASTPTGSSFQPVSKLSEGAQNWMQYKLMQSNLKQQTAMTKKIDEEAKTQQTIQDVNSAIAERERSQLPINDKLADKVGVDMAKAVSDANLNNALEVLERLKKSKLEVESEFYKTPFGKISPYIEKIGGIVGDVSSLIPMLGILKALKMSKLPTLNMDKAYKLLEKSGR